PEVVPARHRPADVYPLAGDARLQSVPLPRLREDAHRNENDQQSYEHQLEESHSLSLPSRFLDWNVAEARTPWWDLRLFRTRTSSPVPQGPFDRVALSDPKP